MRNTHQHPQKFVRRNNGLTCVCIPLKINSENNTVAINGVKGKESEWWTYISINHYESYRNRIRVRVEIIEISERLNLPENQLEKQDFIKETAIARNSNQQLKDFINGV